MEQGPHSAQTKKIAEFRAMGPSAPSQEQKMVLSIAYDGNPELALDLVTAAQNAAPNAHHRVTTGVSSRPAGPGAVAAAEMTPLSWAAFFSF